MKKLFDELAYEVSKKTTEKYSTSFSLGILALKPSIRASIYAIYGYVRLADEIVDSFHGYDKKRLLARLYLETNCALEEGISLNPILQSFQETVHKYAIDVELIRQFLHSMEMDLNKVDYNSERYKEYIYGSAEVVGLMCLQVFTEGNRQRYEELKPYAMKLGSAFQKITSCGILKTITMFLGVLIFRIWIWLSLIMHSKARLRMRYTANLRKRFWELKNCLHRQNLAFIWLTNIIFPCFRRFEKKSSKEIWKAG